MPGETISVGELEDLREDVGKAIESAVERLRLIESRTQQRLHETAVEQQHLRSFLDELDYRLKSVQSGDASTPTSITGPMTEVQLNSLQSQHGILNSRHEELKQASSELEQLSARLSWLVGQIDGACTWVLSNNEDGGEGEANSGGQPTAAGEQVMWAQIIQGQEAERARLAREIHDGPAQAIANTVMRLQFVEQLYKHKPEEVQGELVRLRGALQESLKDVRRFIFNLRPASLTDIGLLTTLRQYALDYGDQYEVEVEANFPESLHLAANQELVVFRVVQEALQNIHKHAEASHISIDMQQRHDGPLVVVISDNGKGFDSRPGRRQAASSGLVGMRERAATVGGTLKIDSKPGVGTTVTLTLPMAKAQG